MASPRRILGRVVLVALLLLGVGVAYVLWAVKQQPAFYVQALQVESATQKEQSREAVRRGTTLSNLLRKAGGWQMSFTAEQINAWFAVDMKENHADTLPVNVAEPRVDIHPGEFTIAAQYQGDLGSAVISLCCDMQVTPENALSLRVRRFRAGKLPIPVGKVLDGIRRAAQDYGWDLRWKEVDGDPVALIRMSAAGGKQWLFDRIELKEGEIWLSGRTEVRK